MIHHTSTVLKTLDPDPSSLCIINTTSLHLHFSQTQTQTQTHLANPSLPLLSQANSIAMVFHIVILKLVEWVLYQLLANSCYRAARKLRSCFFSSSRSNPSPKSTQFSRTNHSPPFPSITKLRSPEKIESFVLDLQGTLLRTTSFFPYFMLVAFEGGSVFRAFLLLLSYPATWLLDSDLQLKVMIFVTFFGLKVKDMENVARAVLPKFYLENLDYQVVRVIDSTTRVGSVSVVSSVPRVMVEVFLKEYLGVENVVGSELGRLFGSVRFSGFVVNGLVQKHRAVMELFGDEKPDLGIGSSCCSSLPQDYLFLSMCKEGYVVTKEDAKSSSSIMPREKYPKPLVFHDGRLAFLPTPAATLIMFLWLPIGILLAVIRLLIGTLLPYKLALLLAAMSGIHIRFHDTRLDHTTHDPTLNDGVLYVCTHRTLLDPVFLSTCLQKPLTAVTYSLSKMSELIAPIRTVRLTRERRRDGETMQRMLREGDLVVCPEGTTCREPYLLRFSSLFAELSDEIVPVAVDTSVGMFYGTTASGLKCLDPIFFLMNPRPRLPAAMSCGGGGKSSAEVANYIQRQLAAALGFECTSLTRRDKYLMLAGNDGIVAADSSPAKKKAFIS
ncbi:Glycerol-3-phosphate acyltransferase 1 [Linum perenne]